MTTTIEQPPVSTILDHSRRIHDRTQLARSEAATLGISPDFIFVLRSIAEPNNSATPVSALLEKTSRATGKPWNQVLREARLDGKPLAKLNAEELKLRHEAEEATRAAAATEAARTEKEYQWNNAVADFERLKQQSANANGIAAQCEAEIEKKKVELAASIGQPFAHMREFVDELVHCSVGLAFYREAAGTVQQRLKTNCEQIIAFALENDVPKDAWQDVFSTLAAITAADDDDEHDPTVEITEKRATKAKK